MGEARAPVNSKLRIFSVSGCNQNTVDNDNIYFHKVPPPNGRLVYISDYFGNKRQVDQHTAWKSILKIKNVRKTTFVCSSHFRKDDYLSPDFPAERHKLRGGAVPSCKLPNCSEKSIQKNNERLERRIKRHRQFQTTFKVKRQKINIVSKTNMELSNLTANHKLNSDCDSVINADVKTICQADDGICNFIEDCKEKTTVNSDNTVSKEIFEEEGESDVISSDLMKPVPAAIKSQEKIEHGIDVTRKKLTSTDFGPQVDTQYRFLQLIKTKEQLSTATGIESFEILKVIVDSVKIVSKNKYEKEEFSLKTEDRVVMTYVKLKQSLSYSFLAIMFGSITPMHCRTIFLETVRTLRKCLKVAIPWPSKEEISRNLPQCFEGFEDTRVVVDCTEIHIQRPKNLCCQIITYSHYKGGQTVKFMTGVTPAGNISFISKAYGGRASDKVIFQQSDLVKLLEPKDGVMVDKGFLIEELCEKNQFKFIQPPFLRSKKKFSKEESIYTAKIAKARVHVERSNQRIKTFKILGSVMSVALVPYIQDIFTIICGTVNLSAPIIGDDKFLHNEMDAT